MELELLLPDPEATKTAQLSGVLFGQVSTLARTPAAMTPQTKIPRTSDFSEDIMNLLFEP
ncbi:MAG: hypothetical protein ACLQIB_28440 [Isosphaeraceae bacterium]